MWEIDIKNKISGEFDTIINNLKTLYNKYQKVLQDIENYTVEDYFKEMKK